jgi:hypothetical protein
MSELPANPDYNAERRAKKLVQLNQRNREKRAQAKRDRNLNGVRNQRLSAPSPAASLSRPSATRAQFNRQFIADLADDWRLAGRAALARLRRESPSNYIKVCAFLVPRQMAVEHRQGVKALTDEQLESAIQAVQEMLDARSKGLDAKLVEAAPVGENVGQIVGPEPAALPSPDTKT